MSKKIDGDKFHNAFLHGGKKIIDNKTHLNEINVFPVPDGDTGSNLSHTMKSVMKNSAPKPSVAETSHSMAEAALIGSRGNIGIIFAQFLMGVSKAAENRNHLTPQSFSSVMKEAVSHTYQATENPVEGTILTVMKDWAKNLQTEEKQNEGFARKLTRSLKQAKSSLRKTQDKLEVLKENDVVDAGAKGFVIFLEGLMEALVQGKTVEEIPAKKPPEIDEHSTVIKDLDKLENRFCTEFLLSGLDMDKEKIEALAKRYADSIIVAGSSSMLRVHAHTNEPEKLLSELRKHGAPKQQKVDDMLKQNEMLAGKHSDIALVVDSACDLPRKIMDRYGVHMVPLNIEFGDEVYLDKQTIRPKQFVQMLEEKNKYPTSSGPAIGQFKELYNKLKANYESIISLHLSDELSGTYSTAKTAAQVIEGTKISVLNTRQVSTSFGLVAHEVARSIRQGANHEEVLEVAAEASDKANILVSVKDLQHMIRGGRVSYTKGLFARLFNVKPVVSLDSEGASTLSGRPISFRGALKKMVSKIEQVEKNEGISTYCIGHTRNKSTAAGMEKKLKAITGKPPEYIMDISPMISSHAGKGAVSISYIKK